MTASTTAAAIIDELQSLGSETTRKTFLRHGARDPIFGVKVGDMKKIQKRIKKDYQLALDLYDSGISDAMYFAGLIADDAAMTRADLQKWVDGAYWQMLSDYTVPWVATGNSVGPELAAEWIESDQELIASAGWSTYSSLMSVHPDDLLGKMLLKKLLRRVQQTIHAQPNRVRYSMNGFVIALGCYVAPMTEAAKLAAEQIGTVSVDMGGTSCQVPYAPDYIRKVEDRGTIGKKRKTAKC